MNESNCVKRKSQYFLSYISPVLKNICDKSGITKDAKIHLNKCFIIISRNIAEITLKLAINGNRKTVSKKNVLSAIGLFLTGDLYKNSLKEADEALYNFNKNKDHKKSSRQSKSAIIFPPCLCEKFFRDFSHKQVLIARESPIILAVVLEYICSQILECVRDNLYNEKRTRFKMTDIDFAIKSDSELSYLFKKNNIKFINGFLIPYIHPTLLIKIEEMKIKKKTKKVPPILRNIKKFQKQGYKLTLCKKSFLDFVKKIINDKFNIDIRFGKNIVTVLQHLVEAYIIELLFKANLLTLYSGRTTVSRNDVIFISQIKQDMYYLKNNMHMIDMNMKVKEGD